MSTIFKVIILVFYIMLTLADGFIIFRLLSNIHTKRSGLPVGPEFFNRPSKISLNDIVTQYKTKGYFGPLNILSIVLNAIIIILYISVANWAVAAILIIYFTIMNTSRFYDQFSGKRPYLVKLIRIAHKKSKNKRQHTIKLISCISGIYCAMVIFENLPYICFALLYL